MAEQGEDFIDDYRSGVFDHPCDTCHGRKVADTVDLMIDAEREAERRAGA